MNTILVTGCGGFVGIPTVQLLLNEGFKVRGLDNFVRNTGHYLLQFTKNPDFEFIYGDVTNEQDVEKALDGVDGVIHLAALVGMPVCERNKALAWITNYEGTMNVLKHKDDKPMVFASTGSVYGKVKNICTEDSPCNPLSIYGRSKLEAEKAVLSHDNTLAFRFATGYGVSPNIRMDLLVNNLVHDAVVNRTLVLYQASFNRTFIHVNDMASALVFGLENINRLKYSVYNVGHESGNITKLQLAEIIKAKTNCNVFVANEGLIDYDQRDYVVSYDKFNETGWSVSYKIPQGVDELIKVIPYLSSSNFKDKL